MAKTSAERQAAYRAKRAGKDSSERRLNTWVNADTYSAIEALAESYGVTRRSVIELLVSNEAGKLKALKGKGKLLADADSVGRASVLRRNDIQGAASNKMQQGPHIDKLLRNAKPKKVSKKPEQQVADAVSPRPAQPLAAQYEFDL